MGSLIISVVFLIAGILMWFATKPLLKAIHKDDEPKVTLDSIDSKLVVLQNQVDNIASRVECIEKQMNDGDAQTNQGGTVEEMHP